MIGQTLRLKDDPVTQLPKLPGVYLFYNRQGFPIYIGKAVNLKNRVSSYFKSGLVLKTRLMVESSVYLSYLITPTPIEALFLESSLIKKYQPKYNSISKDDKSPLFLEITSDQYPRVLLTRRARLSATPRNTFGPFYSSGEITRLLRQVRKIFPFSTHLPRPGTCLEAQIDLCHPCPSAIEAANGNQKRLLKRDYLKNIRHLKNTFLGRVSTVKTNLMKEMASCAANQNFEGANRIKRQLELFDRLSSPPVNTQELVANPNLVADLRREEIRALKLLLKPYLPVKTVKLIECLDVAHLSGRFATASSVAFINGVENTSLYRHYRIRQPKGTSDTDSMREVVKRRIRHLTDWGKPALLVVDGGKAQVKAAYFLLKEVMVPVIGLAKKEEKLVLPVEKGKQLSYSEIRLSNGPAKNLLQRLRNEAHRFAQRYHHQLVKKALLS